MRNRSYIPILLPLFLILLLFFVIKNGSQLWNDAMTFLFVNRKQGCENYNLIKLKPENIPLRILYEDDNMLVVYKPSGMLTHPTEKEFNGTLVNALLYKYGENLSDINGDLCRGIVHRLDRNTSGVLMVAKNNSAHEFLTKNIAEHNMKKYYLALVDGVINEDKIVIEKPIAKHPFIKYKMAINNKYGKQSTTIVNVKERFKNSTLIEVQIITGRTHQIRVHMASIGHPVYNDLMYGNDEHIEGVDGQVLMSYKLVFPKPFTGEMVTIQIPMDEKFSKVLTMLRNEK